MKKILLALIIIITALTSRIRADEILVAHLMDTTVRGHNILYFDYDEIKHFEPGISKVTLLDAVYCEACMHGACYIYTLCYNIKGVELVKFDGCIDGTNEIIDIIEKIKHAKDYQASDLDSYASWDLSFMAPPKRTHKHHEDQE